MNVSIIGIFFIPLVIFLTIKLNLKNLFILCFILSTFTATGILNLSYIDFFITIPHLCALMLWCKIIFLLNKKIIKFDIKISYLLLFFIIYAGISVTYPLFLSTGINVLTPDDAYMPIQFKFQMITQYAYLFLGFLIYIATIVVLKNVNFQKKDFIFVSRIIVAIFTVLLLIQIILPIDLYNSILRNIPASNNQTVDGMIRLTGPTYESSILALTCTPFMGVLFLSLNHKNIKSDLPLLLILSVLIATTKSSTFLVSLISISIFGAIKWYEPTLKYFKTISKNKKNIIYIGLILFLIFGIIIGHDAFESLFRKITGNGTSGSLRLEAFIHHINVFKIHPILGVGFGAIRSYDLFSTWLASLGILGLGSFLLFIIQHIKCNYNNKSNLTYIAFVVILLINLFISVPEPYYLFIWIGLAILQVNSNTKRI